MNIEIKGDDNHAAGRDIFINRVQTLSSKIEHIGEIFARIDRNFENTTGTSYVKKRDVQIRFSSESLCTSLVRLGIPISTALDVVETIIPFLRSFFENKSTSDEILGTNDVKLCILQALAGLQYRSTESGRLPPNTSEEIATWSAAYVRRYGGSIMYLQVIDRGIERDMNYDYLKGIFIPHLLESIIGEGSGQDVIKKYKSFFSTSVIERMAFEIMSFSKALNLYCLKYKTLFYLARDIILNPPHPWMVTAESKSDITAYNMERANHHLQFISSSYVSWSPDYCRSSAHECAAHLCAAILAHYGCMLGVESRYGLVELIRVCDIKKQNKNLVMWEYCGLNNLDADLDAADMTLSSFSRFIMRLHSSLSLHYSEKFNILDVITKCNKLKCIAEKITT